MIKLNLEQLANQYFEERNYIEAENLYLKILSNTPQNYNALYKLGCISILKNDFLTADKLFTTALEQNSDIETLKLLAYVKEQQNETYDAIVMYETILELEKTSFCYEKIGNLYIQLELYDNAINIAKDYINYSQSPIAYRRLFLLYLNLFKHEELQELINEITKKFKNNNIVFNIIGLYKEFIEHNNSDAEKYYEKSLKQGNSIAGYDMAQCLKKQQKYEEAEKYCKKVIDTYPYKNDIIKLLSEIYFSQKKMRKGFKHYLERLLPENIKSLKNPWDGKPKPDKTIMVYCDISSQDIIRNLRYINLLNSKFKNVIIAAPYEMEYFLKMNHFNTIRYEEIAKTCYDNYVLMSELPYYLNINFENIPQLKLDAEQRNLDGDYKVGLIWKVPGDSYKAIQEYSINLSNDIFKNVFEIEGVKYYSFQKNDIWNVLDKYPQINDLSNNLNNIYEYASFIKSMDYIISIDHLTLHLAGILGIPACAILPKNANWYWFNNQEKTEWYPSIKILRYNSEIDYKKLSNNLIEIINNGKRKEIK